MPIMSQSVKKVGIGWKYGSVTQGGLVFSQGRSSLLHRNEGLDISNPKELTHQLYDLNAKGKTVRIPNNKKIIRVAATTKQNIHAGYSNYGKGMIDVSAPGGDFSDLCLSTGLNGEYSWRVGTSMAAPKVAALAGIIIAKHGKGNITPEKVSRIIDRSAIDIETPGYDANSGYGLINVSNALN